MNPISLPKAAHTRTWTKLWMALLLVVATALGPTSAVAQAQATTPPPVAPGFGGRVVVRDEARIDKLEFKDQPLDEVISILRDQFPEENFVTSGNLPSRRISLQLRKVTLPEVLQAIQWACDNEVRFQRDGRLVAVITLPGSQIISRACSLAAYLGETPRDDAGAKGRELKLRELEEALEQYQEMRVSARGSATRSSAKLTFRVHQGTRLLLLTGPKEDVESLEQFVKQLEEGARALHVPPYGTYGMPAAGGYPGKLAGEAARP